MCDFWYCLFKLSRPDITVLVDTSYILVQTLIISRLILFLALLFADCWPDGIHRGGKGNNAGGGQGEHSQHHGQSGRDSHLSSHRECDGTA